jgi:hypothetical protein
MGKYLINCNDAHILSTRNQYNDLNQKEKFRLNFHKTHCWGCKSFDKENRMLQNRLVRSHWAVLTEDKKAKIKERIAAAMQAG